jgi:hypothetical protein
VKAKMLLRKYMTPYYSEDIHTKIDDCSDD